MAPDAAKRGFGQDGLEVEVLPDFFCMPPDVRQLFDAAERLDVQFGAGWYQNLVETVFRDAAQCRLVVLRRHGQAIAALPLATHPVQFGWGWRAMGNYYTTLFAVPTVEGVKTSELAFLLRHLRKEQPRPHALTFAPLQADCAATALLRDALKQSGLLTYEYFCSSNWYQPVSGTGQDYLAQRPGEVRSTLRRMGKKFVANSGRMQIVTDPTSAHIEAFQAIYALSWKQTEPYPDFVPGLMRHCAARKWLRLGLAWVGEVPVAAQFWWVANAKACIYKLAYDPAYRHLSPGTLLTAELMKHVIDQDHVVEIDYLSGDDAYKRSWMSQRRDRCGLVAFEPQSIGGAWGAAQHVIGRALASALSRARNRNSGTASARQDATSA